MDDTTSQPAGNTRGISLIGLIALVISSSIGSGVFALSTDISAAAAPGPALIAWLITGIGFMALNAIVMVCKLVPIFAFILAMVVMFDPAVFTADFWGNLANNLSDPALAPGSVPTQIVNCFMVMM
ncbi:MAG: hypothetical protein UCO70_00195 [Collinsella stercoris]|nr:hypothetical protein [Collinsella stercoris]